MHSLWLSELCTEKMLCDVWQMETVGCKIASQSFLSNVFGGVFALQLLD